MGILYRIFKNINLTQHFQVESNVDHLLAYMSVGHRSCWPCSNKFIARSDHSAVLLAAS